MLGRKLSLRAWFFVALLSLYIPVQTTPTVQCVQAAEAEKPELSLINLKINDKYNVDVEVLVWPDGSVSVPVKYLTKLLNIISNQSEQTHKLQFSQPLTKDTVTINPSEQKIVAGTKTLPKGKHPIISYAEGALSPNDVYVDVEALSNILGLQKLSFDARSQTLNAEIDRAVPSLAQYADSNSFQPKAHITAVRELDIVVPNDKQRLVQSIGLNFSSQTFRQILTTPTFAQNTGSQASYLNNGASVGTTIEGHIGSLPYTLRPNWGYLNGSLNFTDFEGETHWEKNNHQVKAGSLYTGLSTLTTPQLPVLGIQFSTLNASEKKAQTLGTRTFDGKVNGPGEVVLKLNGNEIERQYPIQRMYKFENIALLANQVNNILIIQEQNTGKDEVLLKAEIPYYVNTLNKGEKAVSAFAGRAPFQFRPPGIDTDDGDSGILMQQSNKWVAGGRYFYGVTDRLTAGVSAAADTVFGPAQTSNLFKVFSQITNPDLSGYNSFRRDPNLMQGGNIGASLSYRLGERWLLKADAGLSQSTVLDETQQYSVLPSAGSAGEVSLNYEGKKSLSTLSVYRYSPSYYTPTTILDNFLFDRQGVRLVTNGNRWGTNYSATIDKLKINLDDVLDGGRVDVTRWNVFLNRNLGKHLSAQLISFGVLGQNDLQENRIYNTEVKLNAQLPHESRLELGMRNTNNQMIFNPFAPDQLLSLIAQTNNQTFFETAYNFPLGKKLGNMTVSANISERIRYLTLQGSLHWKAFEFQPFVQTSIGGEENLGILGLGCYYTWDNGRRLGVRYQYSSTTLDTIASLAGSSQNLNHQFYVDLSDTFGWIGNRFKSLGTQGATTGAIATTVYLDRNRDGKRGKDEPILPEIPLVLDTQKTVKTNKDGIAYVDAVGPGLHTVDYDFNNLNVNYTPTSTATTLKVDKRRQTSIMMGLLVTPGNLSGKIHMHDVNGKFLDPTDTVIELEDVKTGEQYQFTYADAKGEYNLSSIPPGDYYVRINTKQAQLSRMKVMTDPYLVSVPLELDGFYDRKGLDFDIVKLIQ